MKKINVITLKCSSIPKVELIENNLKSFQTLVGGYIETVNIGNNIHIILNEEGKLIGLEPNLIYFNDIIMGDVVFVAVDNENEDFTSLSTIQINKVIEYIQENKISKIGNLLFANKGSRK